MSGKFGDKFSNKVKRNRTLIYTAFKFQNFALYSMSYKKTCSLILVAT